MSEILQKYLLSNVFRQADEAVAAAAADPPAVDPAVAAVDPVAADPDPDPSPAPKPRANDPLISTITGLRSKTRDLEAENARLAREAEDARALVERLSKGGATDPAPTPTKTVPPAASNDEVMRQASLIVLQQEFSRITESGIKTYGAQWGDDVRALEAYGVNSPEFVGSVMEIDRDRTHEIMHAIAQDPEKAMALANMTPARRIAEITRMSEKMTMTAAAPVKTEPAAKTDPAPVAPVKPAVAKTVSKAPAPPPPLEPSASKVVDWRQDDASDEEFDRGFREMMKERATMRR